MISVNEQHPIELALRQRLGSGCQYLSTVLLCRGVPGCSQKRRARVDVVPTRLLWGEQDDGWGTSYLSPEEETERAAVIEAAAKEKAQRRAYHATCCRIAAQRRRDTAAGANI